MSNQKTPFPDPDAGRWRDTLALIRSDMDALVAHLEPGAGFSRRIYFALLPGYQALFWHRITRCLLLRGWRLPARLIALWAIYLTRAEIPPTTSLGPSALLTHATGVYLFGRIGARLVVRGDGGFGGGFGGEDIGGGPGYAVVGDDVQVGFGAKVLGPVHIGHRVKLGPGTLVTSDVPDDALVMWSKPRIMLAQAPDGDPR
jgi:serine O-acetyltransferase